MKVTCELRIDLRGWDGALQSCPLWVLQRTPAGADVRLIVNSRAPFFSNIRWFVEEYGSTMNFRVSGDDPEAIASWRRELLGEPEPDAAADFWADYYEGLAEGRWSA